MTTGDIFALLTDSWINTTFTSDLSGPSILPKSFWRGGILVLQRAVLYGCIQAGRKIAITACADQRGTAFLPAMLTTLGAKKLSNHSCKMWHKLQNPPKC